METCPIALTDNKAILMLWNGEGTVYGYLAPLESGQVAVYTQTWPGEYRPTGEVFPGWISALRSIHPQR